MAASVTVGFAPAASPVVTAGVAAAPESEGGGEAGLFAALLALLSQPPKSDDDEGPAIIAPADATATPLSVSLLDPTTLPEATAVATSAQGKSLLRDFGDALIAIDDALDAGKPIDPALEKKLGETVDAIATYLGTTLPPAPAIDPQITALARGEDILPPVDAPLLQTTEPPAEPSEPPEPSAPVGAVTPDDTDEPAEFAPATATLFDVLAATGAPVPTPQSLVPAQSTTTASGEATASVAPASPLLARLGTLVDDLATKLETQSPELATKLETLAADLKSDSVPTDLMDKLGATTETPDADLTRIVETLSEPKPKPVAQAAPQPFTAPALELPSTIAPATRSASNTEPAEVAPAEAAAIDPDAPKTMDAPKTADIAKPGVAVRVRKEPEPTDHDPDSAAPASAAASSTSSDTQPVPAQQLAAAPVARTVHAAYQIPVQQVNLPQVAFEVVRQFEAGNTRFQIRLDPPELGRIDVKLDVDKSGAVSARMTVERPETLDLMQRDQRALQQALQQAGLDSSRTNLEFSLRQNPFAQQGGTGDGRNGQPGVPVQSGVAGGDPAATELATTTYRGTATAGGVNLFV